MSRRTKQSGSLPRTDGKARRLFQLMHQRQLQQAQLRSAPLHREGDALPEKQQQTQHNKTGHLCPAHQCNQRKRESRCAAKWRSRGQQRRQHKSCHRQGDQQANDREQPQLSESGKTREQHGAETADRCQHPKPQGRPDQSQ